MKWLIIAALAVGLLGTLAVAVGPSTSAAPKDPFLRAWEADDPFDGSHMRLMVGGGPRGAHHIAWVDDYWTACEGEPGIGIGTGSIDPSDEDLLHVYLLVRCPTRGEMHEFYLDFTYHDADDTLSDTIHIGTAWNRIGR